MVDLFAGLVHCTFKTHYDVIKYLLEIENMVMVFIHHSQLFESHFELRDRKKKVPGRTHAPQTRHVARNK